MTNLIFYTPDQGRTYQVGMRHQTERREVVLVAAHRVESLVLRMHHRIDMGLVNLGAFDRIEVAIAPRPLGAFLGLAISWHEAEKTSCPAPHNEKYS